MQTLSVFVCYSKIQYGIVKNVMTQENMDTKVKRWLSQNKTDNFAAFFVGSELLVWRRLWLWLNLFQW